MNNGTLKNVLNNNKTLLESLNTTTFSNATFPTTEYAVTTKLMTMPIVKVNATVISSIPSTPSFFLSTEYCIESNHPKAYCDYVATCIFIGYILRLFIMPFVILRIEKLGRNIRSEYNFSLTWLFLIATIPYIDVVEYLTTGDPFAYSRFINIINFVHFVFTVHAIVRYNYYYGFEKSNFRNLSISIAFIIVWMAIAISHMASNNALKARSQPMYAPIFFYWILFLLFAVVQVSNFYFY